MVSVSDFPADGHDLRENFSELLSGENMSHNSKL